jgi:hypothetical protein
MHGQRKSLVHISYQFLMKLTCSSRSEDACWNEFERLLNPLESGTGRTQPKPDLTYAFPVHGPMHTPKGLTRVELFQTLSRKALGGLISHGISCVPTTGLRKWTKDPEKTTLRGLDKSCFPWAVVEMKRDAATSNESTERCYCQAANAAAAALELQAQLFDKLDDASSELPPIIAFTCIGPIVKVWLAFHDQAPITEKRIQVSSISCTVLLVRD